MEIYHLNPDEIQEFSTNIERVKLDHVHRLNLFNEQLIFNTKNEISFHDSKTCLFGQWYASFPNVELKDNVFSHIGILHEQLHEHASLLLTKKSHNDPLTAHEYQKFIDCQEQFVNALDSLYGSVVSTKYGIDYLTKLPNRELSQLILEKHFAMFERNQGEYCIAIADIDFFKQVNDTYGHLTGDRVLQIIARIFLARLRKYDSVCRYGGEEFIFILPNTAIGEAENIMNRMRTEIQNHSIHLNDEESIIVTCSFGLSRFTTGEALDATVDKADKALYLAKKNGRNQVQLSDG